MPSATELLSSLQETLGFKRKKPLEVLPVAAVTPTVAPPEIPAAIEMPAATPAVPALESATPMATEAPPAQEQVQANGLPDWLSPSVPSAVEQVLAPEMPEAWISPEAPPALPVVEVPAPLPEAKAESDPFATSREFNGYMETIRQAQAVLASGIVLTPEEQKKALIAVARSNSLLPKLPPEVLESVLLMRAVAAVNPKFGRDDFQLEMLAAMNVIKTGVAIKG